MVLSATSPIQINSCSWAQFFYFSDKIVPMVENAAGKADIVKSLKEENIVLGCEMCRFSELYTSVFFSINIDEDVSQRV